MGCNLKLERNQRMGNHRTADETRQHHIESMGEPLGSLFNALWQEVAWLYRKWNEYVELYGNKPSRIDLLNKAAPSLFRIVQDSLWEDTLLHLARLTDPSNSSGKPNLTIRRLTELVNDERTSKHVSSLIEEALKATEFCRDWRNRRIAHRDLNLTLAQGAEPLKLASRRNITDALVSIANVLNAMTQHYTDSTTMFDTGTISGGAISLLYVIDGGLNAEKRRREKIRRGEYDTSDLRPRDL